MFDSNLNSDFFSPSATRDLEEAQGRVDAALSGVREKSLFASEPEQPRAIDQQTLKSFEDAAIKYNVPANVLMAMAEKDSGFDPIARSRGVGPKRRGIISMSDEDVRRDGINPYMPEQAIDSAAKKLRTLMDGGNLSIQDAVKAYASGADPSQWGPQANDYANDVLSRTERLKNAYYPPEPAPAPPAPVEPPAEQVSLTSDAARQLGGGAVKGVGSIVHGAAEASQEIRRQVGIPEYRSLGDALGDVLENWGKGIQAGVSQHTKKAIEDSSPGGSLSKPSTWTLGKNPSLWGYTALGLDVFGGMLPIVAGTVASGGSAVVGAGIGGLQGGGAAKEQARDAINKMADDGSIEQESAYYRQLVADGKTPAQALNLTRNAAERFAFLLTTPVSALGGAATAKILHPATKIAAGAGLGGRVAARAAIGAAEEGAQETGEQVAQNVGVNVGAGANIDPMADTFGNFLLGALGGGLPGAGAGALSHGGEHAPASAAQPTGSEPPRDPGAMVPASRPEPGPAPADVATTSPQTQPPAADVATTELQAGPPPAPNNEGPLSRVIGAGAPEHAALSNIVGKRVVLNDTPESFPDQHVQMAGHIVAQDADGVTFKGDDGQEQVIPHEDLSSGKAHIVEAPDAPAMAQPRFVPRETGPSAESVAAAIKEEPAKKPANAEKTKPTVGANYIAGENDTPFKTKEEAAKAIVNAGQNPDDYNIRPASVGDGFFAKKKIELRQPKADEPAKPSEASLAEEAQAKTKFVPKQPERPLSDMSEPELRERMKFIAGQAKTNGGWNKMLSTARREVEAQINKRNSGAKTEPAPAKELTPQEKFLAKPRQTSTVWPEHNEPAETAKPVKAGAIKPAELLDNGKAPEPAEATAPALAPGKWFGAKEKAQGFIDRNGLGETHEIKLTGKHRFDVVEKAKNVDAPKALPAHLAGAKPRYSFGAKQFDLSFASDIDKAAYIAAQKTPSKRDADYVKFVSDATRMSEAEVRAHGAKVRDAIKSQARDAEPGKLNVGAVYVPPRSVAAPVDGVQRGATSVERMYLTKASIAPASHQASGINAGGLKEHLVRGADGPLIEKMIGSGRIVLHDDASTLPVAKLPDGVVQGVTMPDGAIHLVAGNLSPKAARAVLLHEAFHAGAEPLVGSRGWKTLLERVQNAADSAVERGDTEGFWPEALASAEHGWEPTAEEIAAYAVENRERAPVGIREAIDNFIGQVKAWALRRFGVQFGDVTPGQLRALAVAALRSHASGAPGPTAASSNGASYSMAPAPVAENAKTLFDKDNNALRNFITNRMTGGNAPAASFLGAIPVRPLFLELSKHLPSARYYIDTKTAMDAMRNKYAQETDETLQRWFKFANKIVRNGVKVVRPNLAENNRLMDLMHDSTIAGADPSKPWEVQKEDKPTDAERHAAWRALKPRYDALSDEAKAIYAEVRDSYKRMADESEALVIQNVRRAMEAALKRAKREHADAMQRIDDEGLAGKERKEAIEAADRRLAMAQTRVHRNRVARLKRMREEFEKNRVAEPYFPLSRFGNYYVTVRDADQKVISFSKFESASDQSRFAKEQGAIPGQTVETGLAETESNFQKVIDPKFMANLDAILDDGGVGREVRDQVWQRYLETLPDLSMRKHRIHRKNRAGFNTDALRAFAHVMFHGGHQMARLQYGIDLQGHMDNIAREVRVSDDPVRSGALYNEMKRAHEFTINPSGSSLSYRLSSFAFLWTMAFNVSSAIVNTEQMWSKGVGNLAFDIDTKAGRKAALSQLARATKDFMIGKGFIENASTLTDEERDAIRKGYELGVIDRTQAHDVAAIAETGVSYNPLWNMAMKAASAPMHHTERFNREVTFVAAYRIARGAGLTNEEAIKKASDLTWMTHYDNQSSSKPRFMRGDVTRVVFALKGFQANVLFRVFYDANQSLKAATPDERKMAIGRLTTMLAMSLPLAGVSGAFGFHVLMSIAAFFMGLAGNDDDPEEELRRIVLQTTGDSIIGRAVGGMVMDGAPGYLTGTALSDRVGNADLWFRSSNRDMNPEQKWQYLLEQLGGAPLGLAHQIAQGFGEIGKGNIERGVEKMAPAFIKNPTKAIRYAMDGVADKDGNPIVEYVPWQDIVKQAIGFTPAEIKDRLERNTFQKNAQERIHHEKSIALREAARARMAGEGEDAAQGKVERYNERFPEERITPKSIRSAIKALKRRSDRMEFGVDLDDKLEDRIKDQTAPSIYSRSDR